MLWIQFLNGRTYRYWDVPAEVYEELLEADSHGHYFNAEIRDIFAYARG